MKYEVFVDDNYHYMDEEHRSPDAEYDSLDAAIAACKQIVDDWLATNYKPGMAADELYRGYTGFGEDPWIKGAGGDPPFSAWNYAKQRCAELCDR